MKRIWIIVAAGLLAALIMGGILSPFASPEPDGLERVAEDEGFAAKGEAEPVYGGSPMPDYRVPGIESRSVSTRLAGVIGTGIAFVLGLGAGFGVRALKRARAKRHDDSTSGS